MIRARSNVFLIGFFAIWLCGWAVGEAAGTLSFLTGVTAFVQGKPGAAPEAFFLPIWLAFWTIGGLTALAILAWMLAGREVIVMNDESLIMSRELGAFRRSQSFDLAGVRNLRYAPLVYDPFSITGSWWYQFQLVGLAGGSVAFDHGGKTHRFGSNLSETEAARLIATIEQVFKFPEDRDVEPLPISR